MEWPPILEPVVLERFGWDDARLDRELDVLVGALLPTLDIAALAQTGVDYPFARPTGSFVLDDTDIGPLTPDLHDLLQALEQGVQATPTPRYPLLAIGANGAPDTLIRKLAHLTDPEDRRVYVLAGRLHDFDVAPLPRIAPYGALPATLMSSPGTRVRCSASWVTAAAFTALTQSEMSYDVGRLDPMLFESLGDEHSHQLTTAYVYVSRWGNLLLDGERVALAAMPADHRQTPSLTQTQLLDRTARLTLGRMHTGRDLIERLVRDPLEITREVALALRPLAEHFDDPAWTPYPGTTPRD
ncbi:MAG: hypothetical protein AAGC46_02225 [Solirubrobacteraceae bacterium]|nr:hypothetical protein [Patulibacter sp.]